MDSRRFFVRFLLSFVCLGFFSYSHTIDAQDWVREMFSEIEHDFGTVPRGGTAEHYFKLTNKYEQPVHIASVRSSCGCTIPRIEKADLKTYEEGSIICEFNTRSFIGAKTAVVTVVFTKPFYGEMQLNVKGNIRSDIVTEPGMIDFGDLQRGEEKNTVVKISYAGKNAWEIQDVRSVNAHLGVKLNRETVSGRVAYSMDVRLKPDAPTGEFNDQIVLVTNDQQYNLVTIPVRGNIQPPLVMPASVELGSVKTGARLATRVVIKGNSDFEITKIDCPDQRFSFTTPSGMKRVHIVPVEFEAGEDIGAFRERVTIHTSLAEDNTASTFISGNVIQGSLVKSQIPGK